MTGNAIAFWLVAGALVLAVLGTVLSPLARGGRRANRFALLGAAVVPLMTTSIYHSIGGPDALRPDRVAPTHRLNELAMQDAVLALRKRLALAPDDADGWLLLARSSEALERWADAADAYREVLRRVPDDAVLMTDLADVLATLQGGNLAGEPASLVDAALRIEPSLPKAVALKAMIAYRDGRDNEAANWWRRLAEGQPPDSPAARAAAVGLARVQTEKNRNNQAATAVSEAGSSGPAAKTLRGPSVSAMSNETQPPR